MQIKKLVLTGAAAALVGGFAFAPVAQAEETNVPGVVTLHTGGGPEGGYIVAEGDGIEVNPLDDGHIGAHGDASGQGGLYGSCDGRDEDGNFKDFDPQEPSGDTQEKCSPA